MKSAGETKPRSGWRQRSSASQPVTARAPDLVGTVARALTESGLDPARLELEITEQVMLEESRRGRGRGTGPATG
jgi:EAL domain-containing protein (putative c-di-GMP-specific phosphodiesterase class I)